MKKKKLPKIRKPIAPPQKTHKDKSKYDRKESRRKKFAVGLDESKSGDL